MQNAWVTEDSYISFRVVDNFVNGYGLVWNIDERVQTYTNPLWTMVHIPFYYLTDNIFYLTIVIGTLFSFATLFVLAKTFYYENIEVFFLIFFALVTSQAYIEFSTSGLENSLSHFLLAIFYTTYFKQKKDTPWQLLSLIAALAMLTRLDNVMFLIPIAAHLAITNRRSIKWGQIFTGALPLIFWLCFSLFYYGFIFPNTKYAKLNTGISLYEYMAQSRFYFMDLAQNHLSSFMVITSGVLFALYNGFLSIVRKTPAATKYAFAGMGIILYNLYIASVSGDFYSGRFASTSVLAATIIFAFWITELEKSKQKNIILISFISLTIIFVAGHYIKTTKPMRPGRIEDARQLSQGTFTIQDFNPWAHPWAHEGMSQKIKSEEFTKGTGGGNYYVLPRTNAGFMPYYAGPNTIIVDSAGITDPLIARLPIEKSFKWHAGHFWRNIPKGYIHFRKTGDMQNMDPSLMEYYKKLRYVISGPLFDKQRLRDIIDLNLGKYDHLLEKYIKEMEKCKKGIC